MLLKNCVKFAPTIPAFARSIFLHNGRNKKLLIANSWLDWSCVSTTQRNRNYATEVKTSKTKIDADNKIAGARHKVYYGILATQIRTVKIFSLSTSAVGITCQPYIYNAVAATQNTPVIVAACSVVGFFTFVTPWLLHLITKKYVTQLDYKPETNTYVATTVNFIGTNKEIEFSIADVKVPDVPGMFTTFEAKGVPLFLDPRLFEDPSHYAKIMGYDKPIDFKLFETSNNKEKPEK